MDERPRARDIGVAPGGIAPAPLNAITDVSGMKVGHETLIRGDDVRTRVTAIKGRLGNVAEAISIETVQRVLRKHHLME